ncbi:MAG: glycoside hydrolase family 16 protein [Myxococcales bacterium]|nr:glycoside hydrolase family 16 protein [Deltaproteobacteria bacterium]NND27151.1 glycoside hydrolase family 16 protein [Myxococcales bacterium]MBT8482987.1 glycoside hydrolase family 16 protein [Deltaproteobacteria bacterium]NNK09072.1 glycoside hydrolase family 16 protein [Myxococcales bacterium]NNK41367.1 glycoside hydrolase family 16 protein [Myxococcales bacterium]
MTRTVTILYTLALITAVGPPNTGCDSSSDIVDPPAQWVLTMSDEFDSGSSPSAELWTIETGYGPEDIPPGWGNDEWQEYTASPDNVRIEDGNLVITAQCANAPSGPCSKRDGSITSARLVTKVYDCDGGKCGFEQERGRFEARIKIPEGEGLWPAFWMLGANIDEVPWPGCGEIDVVENFGRDKAVVKGSLHGPGYSGGASVGGSVELSGGETFADDFHVFAVEWDPGRMTFLVDDEVYHIIRSAEVSGRGDWVFNNEFFMLLNLAVGGAPVPNPPSSIFPAEMLIDYVRVFERAQ